MHLHFVQIMVIDYKLPYPSGTATAVLINGFHTSKGDKMAKYVFFFFPGLDHCVASYTELCLHISGNRFKVSPSSSR